MLVLAVMPRVCSSAVVGPLLVVLAVARWAWWCCLTGAGVLEVLVCYWVGSSVVVGPLLVVLAVVLWAWWCLRSAGGVVCCLTAYSGVMCHAGISAVLEGFWSRLMICCWQYGAAAEQHCGSSASAGSLLA